MKLLTIIPIHFEDKTIEQAVFTRMNDHMSQVLSHETQLDFVALPPGATASIECRFDRATNAPLVVRLAMQAERDGYDGVFVSDMDMCGVDICRDMMQIPVIGGFRASANTAMMLARSFSIITVLENVVDMQREHIAHFGLTDRFASIRVANIPVEDLIRDPMLAVPTLVDEAVAAIENDDAQSIIFGCTGFVTVADPVMAALRERGYDIPVIDPNRIAINYLEILAKNKLTQSKRSYIFPSAIA